MSREATAKLAKASWIILLLITFGRPLIGKVIGPVLADLLVFVFAVLAIPVALYCLFRIRAYGTRGILGHAIATLAIGALLLAIWIPNFLASRERARARHESRGEVVTVHVSRDGVITMNGSVATLDAVAQELKRVSTAGGTLRYSRDDPSADPHPIAMEVMKAAADTNIPIEMALSDGS